MQEIDKLFLAKLEDKVSQVKKHKGIESTDFLDEYQQHTAQKWLEKHYKQVLWAGGIEQAERKIAIFYSEKLESIVKEKPETVLPEFIRVIQIILPKQIEPYTHKQYLGALMKIGLKREKIGDIQCK